MHPGSFVFSCHSLYGVRDDEVILCALARRQEAVVVHLANIVSAENSIPPIVVLANSGVEVSKQNKLMPAKTEFRM